MNRIRTLAASAIFLSACAPALDWRESRIADTPLRATFPCRPASHARTVDLAGSPARVTLHACTAAGATYAIGWAEVPDPTRMSTVLDALAAAAAANLGAPAAPAEAFQLPGMTPNPSAGARQLAGRLPDGTAVQSRVVVFAAGLQVFQATVVGARPDPANVATFMESLTVRP